MEHNTAAFLLQGTGHGAVLGSQGRVLRKCTLSRPCFLLYIALVHAYRSCHDSKKHASKGSCRVAPCRVVVQQGAAMAPEGQAARRQRRQQQAEARQVVGPHHPENQSPGWGNGDA